MSYLALAKQALTQQPAQRTPDLSTAALTERKYEVNEETPLEQPTHLVAMRPSGEPHGMLDEADADEVEGRYWYPSPGTPFYFQDDFGRPCSIGEAVWWTWAGSMSWFRAAVYPPPSWS